MAVCLVVISIGFIHDPRFVIVVVVDGGVVAMSCLSSVESQEYYTLQIDGGPEEGTAPADQPQQQEEADGGGTSRNKKKRPQGKPCCAWAIEILIAFLLLWPIVMIVQAIFHSGFAMDWATAGILVCMMFIIICQVLVGLCIGGW
jgi:hypothetical protein